MESHVALSTQNQAMNALVFLYKKVLKTPLTDKIYAVRAFKKNNVPVVLTRDEVRKIINIMENVSQLIVKILYGSGLRVLTHRDTGFFVGGRTCVKLAWKPCVDIEYGIKKTVAYFEKILAER